jgi:hypothetical protein
MIARAEVIDLKISGAPGGACDRRVSATISCKRLAHHLPFFGAVGGVADHLAQMHDGRSSRVWIAVNR